LQQGEVLRLHLFQGLAEDAETFSLQTYSAIFTRLQPPLVCDRDSRVRFPAGAGSFSPPRPERLWGPPSLLQVGTRGSFPGGKAAGAWSWPLTSI